MSCQCFAPRKLSSRSIRVSRRSHKRAVRWALENDNGSSTVVTSEVEAPPKPTGGPIYYAGGGYSEKEWQKAINKGGRFEVPVWETQPAPVADALSQRFFDAMAFYGPVPEIVNGRLAMLGFTTGALAELNSGMGIIQQWEAASMYVMGFAAMIITMTLLPYVRGPFTASSAGPFTPEAELMNGRFAMIGISALVMSEWVGGIVYSTL